MGEWLDELEMAGVRMASELGEVVLCPEGFARLIAAARWAEASLATAHACMDDWAEKKAAEEAAEQAYRKITGRQP